MFGRLFLLFVVVPLLDLWLLLWVGSRLGAPATLLVVVGTAALGAHLCRREGSRTLSALRDSLWRTHVLPERLADAVLVLIGGAFLLTPGFLTDGVGLAMVLPITRPLVRRGIFSLLPVRLSVDVGGAVGSGSNETGVRDIDVRVRDVGTDSEPNGNRVE